MATIAFANALNRDVYKQITLIKTFSEFVNHNLCYCMQWTWSHYQISFSNL